jgi:transposase
MEPYRSVFEYQTARDAKVVRQYEAGDSLAKIATRFGVSKSTVGDILRFQGVPLRPRGRPRKDST